MSELTYAKAGHVPADWMHLDVIDLDGGAIVPRVVEVDTEKGWLIQRRVGSGHWNRLEGRFELRYRPDRPQQ